MYRGTATTGTMEPAKSGHPVPAGITRLGPGCTEGDSGLPANQFKAKNSMMSSRITDICPRH